MSKLTIRWMAATAASVAVLAGVGCARQEVKSADTGMTTGMSTTTSAPALTSDPVMPATGGTGTMGTRANGTGQGSMGSMPSDMPSTPSAPSTPATATWNNTGSTAPNALASETELPARADRN